MTSPAPVSRARRALAFVLVLVVVAVVNVATGLAVHSQSGAFFVGPFGILAQLPFAALLAVLCWAIVVRVGSVPTERTPFAPELELSLRELGAGISVGIAVLAALIGCLAAIGAVTITPGDPFWPLLPSALISFVVDATIQQVALVSFALAVQGAGRRPGVGALGLATVMFVLPHVPIASGPVYLLNVALFAVLTLLLTFRREKPSLAAAVGLHGGWNTALVVCDGASELFPGEAALLFRMDAHDTLWTGGAAGLESGLAYTLPCLALLVIVIALRAR